MYVIAGATGRVGSVVAETLLKAGEPVRVLVRSQEKAERWLARGAEARVLDLRDQTALAGALTDAAGFFALLPFDLTASDPDQHARELTASITAAVRQSRPGHVVMLSSGGADLPSGTGPISSLHELEQALLSTGSVITALRPGHFQEKAADLAEVARATGVYPVFAASSDRPMPMVATEDVGTIAARTLLTSPSRSGTVDVLGPAYTERQAAQALGDVLGRTLEVVNLPEAAWAGALIDSGLPPHAAQSIAQLYRADEQGLLAPRADRRELGTTELTRTLTHCIPK